MKDINIMWDVDNMKMENLLKLSAKEINDWFNILFLLGDQDIKDEGKAQKTIDFIEKFAEIESLRGSEGIYIITELLDNNLVYDGVDIRQYYENIMEEELPKSFDLIGAKILWIRKSIVELAK